MAPFWGGFMPAKGIVCAYCGTCGEIDVWGVNMGLSSSAMFQYVGHNPFSGHMHFQCPVCGIVSLISPLAVLDGSGMITADIHPSMGKTAQGKSFLNEAQNTAMTSLMARQN
ncbi:MAG TPA: hypothetical protein PK425_02900 [Syntrophales bacterium]|jgi:hypothetical protein|nr:hypothetical protein [Syntrophales bacterium]HQA82196.1 hypothetical protein [Syntrophales bacterium]